MKAQILHVGEVVVDRGLPYGSEEKNPLAFTHFFRSKSKKIELPVSVILIEDPKHGLILLDSGWDEAVRTHPIKYLGVFHYWLNQPYINKHKSILEQLTDMGYKPSDIDYIFLSHLHSDHASGIMQLKEAKHIVVNKNEYDFALKKPIYYVPKMYKDINLEFYTPKETGIGPKGLSCDYFGDGTYTFIELGGHTKGLVATKVKLGDKYFLYTADCGYAKRCWEEHIMPGVCIDKEELSSALEWVGETAKDPDIIETLANHDPDVKPHIIGG